MKVIGITGANGLLGWHACVHLQAAIASARFIGREPALTWKAARRNTFKDLEALRSFAEECDVILHFAGVNRGTDHDVERGNVEIATRLIEGLEATDSRPHVVYANSTHADRDSVYGRSKRRAGHLLASWAEQQGACFTNLIVPHVFGEHARPFYNNVTATFCKQIIDGVEPDLDPDGFVELVHVGSVVEQAIEAGSTDKGSEIRLKGTRLSVPELFSTISTMHAQYAEHIVPDLSDGLHLRLFNTYRSYLSHSYPRHVPLNIDPRGRLVEAVKGGGGGQTFVSSTKPGFTRGNHFHINKMERFMVLEGKAQIHVRKMLDETVTTYEVSGDNPAYVDIPTLHTHSIENIGESNLLTLFWAHELFDSARPDTYYEEVQVTA